MNDKLNEQPIELGDYTNGREDRIKEKVDLLWNQIMDPNTSEEERNQIIEELMDRIEEHELKNVPGMSR